MRSFEHAKELPRIFQRIAFAIIVEMGPHALGAAEGERAACIAAAVPMFASRCLSLRASPRSRRS